MQEFILLYKSLVNVTWKMTQMENCICLVQVKYNLVAQMKDCIFQKLAQMQYALPNIAHQGTNINSGKVKLKSYGGF